MAGYPKIWTTILHEDWFKPLTCTQRGIVLQLFLLAKQNGDTGILSYNGWQHFSMDLHCNRATLVHFVSKNSIKSRIVVTLGGDGILRVKIPKYREYQGLTCSNLVEKSTRNEHTTRPEQTKALPEHTELVTFFCDQYEQAIKSKYPFTGKDAKKLSDLLRTYGLDQAKQIIDLYLTDRDDFLTKTGHTTGVLSTRAARYAERLTATQTGRNPDVPY